MSQKQIKEVIQNLEAALDRTIGDDVVASRLIRDALATLRPSLEATKGKRK